MKRTIQRLASLRMKRKEKFQESRKLLEKILGDAPAIAEPPCRDGGSSDGVLDIDIVLDIVQIVYLYINPHIFINSFLYLPLLVSTIYQLNLVLLYYLTFKVKQMQEYTPPRRVLKSPDFVQNPTAEHLRAPSLPPTRAEWGVLGLFEGNQRADLECRQRSGFAFYLLYLLQTFLLFTPKLLTTLHTIHHGKRNHQRARPPRR